MINDLYKYILLEMCKINLQSSNYTDGDFITKTSNKQTINYREYNSYVNSKRINTKGITNYKDQNKKRY